MLLVAVAGRWVLQQRMQTPWELEGIGSGHEREKLHFWRTDFSLDRTHYLLVVGTYW